MNLPPGFANHHTNVYRADVCLHLGTGQRRFVTTTPLPLHSLNPLCRKLAWPQSRCACNAFGLCLVPTSAVQPVATLCTYRVRTTTGIFWEFAASLHVYVYMHMSYERVHCGLYSYVVTWRRRRTLLHVAISEFLLLVKYNLAFRKNISIPSSGLKNMPRKQYDTGRSNRFMFAVSVAVAVAQSV
jgi:hypothetical protein